MTTKQKRIFTLTFWLIFLIPVLIVSIVFIRISTGHLGFMPTFEELENPKSNLASEVFSSDQKILGKYYLENRTVVNFEELSPYLVKALVATEDIRFYDHSGIDQRSLVRVAVKTLLLGQRTGGGSTITQQLAKNLFPRNMDQSIVIVKFKEWITAIKLERNYTKDEIMAMYFNTVPFGSGAFGVKSAARIFFNTTPDSLKIEEAALLVGIVNAPTRFSPIPPYHPGDSLRIRRQTRSLERRNVVLSQMEKYDILSQLTTADYDSIRNIPIQLNYRQQAHDKGSSTYFREYLRTALTATRPERENYPDWNFDKYSEDSLEWETNPLYGWCNKQKKPDGSGYNLYKDGLRIFTTINSKMQRYAEESVSEHLGGEKSHQELFYNDMRWRRNPPFSDDISDSQYKEIMDMFIRTSERYRVYRQDGLTDAEIKTLFDEPTEMTVFSWGGAIDTLMSPRDSILYYKKFLRAGFVSMEPQTGYVRAYVGGVDYEHFKYDHVMYAKRQVGSTFKPFLYTMAMIDGYSPCFKVANIPWYFDPAKQKPNYSKNKREGEMVSLKYGLALSLNQISAWLINRYPPSSVINLAQRMGIKSYIPDVPSICVGSPEIKLIEMVGAYGTYANKGVYTEPIFVTRIEDKNGNIIATFTPKKQVAISEGTAYMMLDLMKGVVDFGTSSRIRYKYDIHNPIAGKTGTTNDNSDAWFIGITPGLVSGAWVGGELRSIRFYNGEHGQGSGMALPVWTIYMKKIYADKTLNIPTGDFDRPLRLPAIIDCEVYEQQRNNELNDDYNSILDDENY